MLRFFTAKIDRASTLVEVQPLFDMGTSSIVSINPILHTFVVVNCFGKDCLPGNHSSQSSIVKQAGY